jgi:hypothetical protein
MSDIISIPLNKGSVIRCTPILRYISPTAYASAHGVKILQQAWECVEDGTIEWRNVPHVIE